MATASKQELKQHIKQVFDRASGTLFIADSNGTVMYANHALAKKTGYDTPQIIGTKAGSLWGGYMSKSFYRDMWHTIKNDRNAWTGCVTNQYKSGTQDDTMNIAPIETNDANETLFLECNPEGDSESQRQEFQEKFKNLATGKKTGLDALMQYGTWLAPEESTNSKTEYAFEYLVTEYNSIHDALTDIFVRPTRDILGERYSDHKLIVDAQADPAAFQIIYNKYEHVVRYYFIRRLSDASVAHDLAQDTFMKAFMYLDRYKLLNASYKTYLLRIAHNILVNHFRDTAREVKGDNEKMQEVPYNQKHEVRMDNMLLWRQIANFPESARVVMHMRYKDELSIREIATILGKSENSIKLHLSRARKKLRVMLGG